AFAENIGLGPDETDAPMTGELIYEYSPHGRSRPSLARRRVGAAPHRRASARLGYAEIGDSEAARGARAMTSIGCGRFRVESVRGADVPRPSGRSRCRLLLLSA